MCFLQVNVRPLRPNKEEMTHSSMEGLFFDKLGEVFEEGIWDDKCSRD